MSHYVAEAGLQLLSFIHISTAETIGIVKSSMYMLLPSRKLGLSALSVLEFSTLFYELALHI